MKLTDRLLEHSVVYRLWQQPFVEQKLLPLRKRDDLPKERRVLDVGCGPGTNTSTFAQNDYLGVDINPHYIADARRRYGRAFRVGDVTDPSQFPDEQFDFIFVNSMLHHIDAAGVARLMARLSKLLTADGHIHVLDLVLPPRPISVARVLARMDRGDFPRPVSELRSLVEQHLSIVDSENYFLWAGGIPLWHFVYFKATARPNSAKEKFGVVL